MFSRFNRLIIISVLLTYSGGLCDSGGPLTAEQTRYDINYYEIKLKIEPQIYSISGYVKIQVNVVEPLENFILDLDGRLPYPAYSLEKVKEN